MHHLYQEGIVSRHYLTVIEWLESRRLRSATLFPNGKLQIVGTSQDEAFLVTISDDTATLIVNDDGIDRPFVNAQVKEVVFITGPGDDQASVSTDFARHVAFVDESE